MGGLCSHHPSGDIKKISTYNGTPASSTWGSAAGSHWRVYWSATTSGKSVSEGGSSGSPMFNTAGNSVGDLTGGSSSCSAAYFPDYFGKFSYSWDQNGSNNDEQLKPWLDPNTSGVIQLPGIYYSDCLVNQEVISNNFNVIELFPNPAKDYLNINFKNIESQKDINLTIYNNYGKELLNRNESVAMGSSLRVKTDELNQGVYILKIIIDDTVLTKHFIVLN